MIESLDALRHVYVDAKGRALTKQIDHLDAHCRHFIALSPFVVIASCDAQGAMDASPRGGAPGFVRLVNAHTLWIPDSPGNNRLDTLSNIIATGNVGLLFMIPGVDETLRVNGRARLNDDPLVVSAFSDDKRTPKLVIDITVTDAYLHCAKAFMRAKLWSANSHINRGQLPTMGEMLNDQTGTVGVAETQAEMQARYAIDL
jgi:uncharacterized protein